MRESTGRGHRGRRAPRVLDLAFAALVALSGAATAADPAKTLRVAFSIAESSFDPQFSSDAPSDSIIDNIFETMLTYDYLARPVKLVPRALETMPEVSDGGSTYTFRFRKGVFFTPDPAFGGKPRELVAADQEYAIRRLLDPQPISNGPVTIGFRQNIAANDALRTGTYSKTLTFTLSTTTP